ncbi:cytosine permease, partial [Streptomyces sp. TRM76130]|nr:cytosine permease [Streptomyces sp. TRM76130]
MAGPAATRVDHPDRRPSLPHEARPPEARTPHMSETAAATVVAHGLETRGIEQVPDHERTARVRGLFPIWVGANISVLLLTMGASLV